MRHKKDDDGLTDVLEKPVNITAGRFSVKMPAVILILLVLLLGGGLIFWMSDIHVAGCHKPGLPIPGLRR